MPKGEFDLDLEVATVEEFLWLLRERTEDSRGGPLQRAVFVARLRESRGSRYPFPKVTRRVVAAFARRGGVVCLSSTTSNSVELPEMARAAEERQRAVHEEVLSEIRRGLEEAGLANEVPIYEGFLRRSPELRHT